MALLPAGTGESPLGVLNPFIIHGPAKVKDKSGIIVMHKNYYHNYHTTFMLMLINDFFHRVIYIKV